MLGRTRSELKILTSIFGPIIILCAALVIFQYANYSANKKRLEAQISRQQGLMTSLAADRMQSWFKDVVCQLGKLEYPLATRSPFMSNR